MSDLLFISLRSVLKVLVALVYQLKAVLCLQWGLERHYFPSLVVGFILVLNAIMGANHRPF